MTDKEWLKTRARMSEDGLKEACRCFAQLPSFETYSHLKKRLADYDRVFEEADAAFGLGGTSQSERIAAAAKALDWTVERAEQVVADYSGPDGAEGERAQGFKVLHQAWLQTAGVEEVADWLMCRVRHDRSQEQR